MPLTCKCIEVMLISTKVNVVLFRVMRDSNGGDQESVLPKATKLYAYQGDDCFACDTT